MSYRLSELVAALGGSYRGPDCCITRLAPLEQASEGDLAFLANPRYRNQVETSQASAIIVTAAVADTLTGDRALIIAPDPYVYFARVARLLNPRPEARAGIHPSAVVSPEARVAASAEIREWVSIGAGAVIGERVIVHAGCVIGEGSQIGDDCILYPRVTVYQGVTLGQRCTIQAGAVIGSDGFGMAWTGAETGWLTIPQTGGVRIGDDVDIGANTTIDRGALADTVIASGAKLDNQIQIAHNVEIGRHTAMAACAGVAGSTKIGAYCMVGGAGMISGHLTIGDRVHISGGTLVAKSIREPGHYTAVYPLASHRDWTHNAAQLRQIDKLFARVKTLESELAAVHKNKDIS